MTNLSDVGLLAPDPSSTLERSLRDLVQQEQQRDAQQAQRMQLQEQLQQPEHQVQVQMQQQQQKMRQQQRSQLHMQQHMLQQQQQQQQLLMQQRQLMQQLQQLQQLQQQQRHQHHHHQHQHQQPSHSAQQPSQPSLQHQQQQLQQQQQQQQQLRGVSQQLLRVGLRVSSSSSSSSRTLGSMTPQRGLPGRRGSLRESSLRESSLREISIPEGSVPEGDTFTEVGLLEYLHTAHMQALDSDAPPAPNPLSPWWMQQNHGGALDQAPTPSAATYYFSQASYNPGDLGTGSTGTSTPSIQGSRIHGRGDSSLPFRAKVQPPQPTPLQLHSSPLQTLLGHPRPPAARGMRSAHSMPISHSFLVLLAQSNDQEEAGPLLPPPQQFQPQPPLEATIGEAGQRLRRLPARHPSAPRLLGLQGRAAAVGAGVAAGGAAAPGVGVEGAGPGPGPGAGGGQTVQRRLPRRARTIGFSPLGQGQAFGK